MPSYVERDGDWVRRPPFYLEDARFWVFTLPADIGPLAALCDRHINGVQSVWRAIPIGRALGGPLALASPVLAVAVDIARGRSEHPKDAAMGYLLERDLGFFVPIVLEHIATGARRFGALLPYLWVDSPAAMVAGREIYGFPKVLATLDFDPAGLRFEARAFALPSLTPHHAVGDEPVARVEVLALPPGAVSVTTLLDATMKMQEALSLFFGWPPPQGGFDRVRLVLLKQFRDAAVAQQACHQSLVEVVLPLLNFQKADILAGASTTAIHTHAFPRLAAELGLQRDPLSLTSPIPRYLTGPVFRAALDFRLPAGTTLWP